MGFMLIQSPAHTKQSCEQRFIRIITPLIKDFIGDSPLKIKIDNNQLCINGVALGDYRQLCNFDFDSKTGILSYYHGNSNRLLGFGLKGLEADYYKVAVIIEGERIIYQKSENGG